MGKNDKGDRKASKASSSAQAAEFLASRGAQTGGFGGFGGGAALPGAASGFAFGGVAAARLAAPALGGASLGIAASPATSSNTTSSAEAQFSSQLDGEVAQCLRHLSKKDAVTKLKALQALRALIPSKSVPELSLALPPWVFLFPRLSQDPNRSVRCEASVVLGELATAVGKAIAPHVKSLVPAWWLAQFDPHEAAAAAARTAFQACFPGTKQYDALRYCAVEILSYLTDQATSNAQQLGDARKDTPEEMEERYERVVSASLLALSTLLQSLSPTTTATANASPAPSPPSPPPPPPSTSAAPQLAQAWSQVSVLLGKPGYLKGCIGSKSPLIRSATYTFLREVASGLAGASTSIGGGNTQGAASREGAGGDGLSDALGTAVKIATSQEVAGAVLGALGEKDPGNHGAMWGMVLTYIKFFPDCWSLINIRKVVLPRLTSLLRHGCYGSHTVSWPALLPLLSLLPRSIMEPSPDVPVQLLEATWQGLMDASASKAGRSAGCQAYQEVLQWLLVGVAPEVTSAVIGAPPTTTTTTDAALEAEVQETILTYRQLLLQGTLQAHILPAALGAGGAPAAAADAASGVVLGLVKRLGVAGTTGAAGAANGHAVGTGGQGGARAAATADALRAVQDALSRGAAVVVEQAASSSSPVLSVFGRCEELVVALRAADMATGNRVASAVVSALVDAMQGTPTGVVAEGDLTEATPPELVGAAAPSIQLPASASQLLAVLIRTPGVQVSSGTGSAVGGGGAVLDLSGLLRACRHGPEGSSATAAHVQLLLSWLLGSRSAEADWKTVVQDFTGLPLTSSTDTNTSPSPSPSPSLRLALLLVTSLSDTLSSRDHDTPDNTTTDTHTQTTPNTTPPTHPWEPALDTLATHLATTACLEQAATTAVADAAAGANAGTTGSPIVTAFAAQPTIMLLAALLGGGGSHVLLISSDCARAVATTLVSSLGDTSVPASSIPLTGQTVLAIARALFAPGSTPRGASATSLSRTTPTTATSAAPSPRAVFKVASDSMSSLVFRAAQLTWQAIHGTPTTATSPYVASCGPASQAAVAPWLGHDLDVPQIDDEDVLSESDDDDDDQEEQYDASTQAYTGAGGGAGVVRTLAMAAWAQGHALRTAASGLDDETVAKVVEQVVAVLMVGLAPSGDVPRHGGAVHVTKGDTAAQAAGYVQQMVKGVGSDLRPQVVGEVMRQMVAALDRIAQASGTGTWKKGKGSTPPPLSPMQLFLPHLIHAMGPQVLIPVQADASGRPSAAVPSVGVLVHLLAVEAAAAQSLGGSWALAHLPLGPGVAGKRDVGQQRSVRYQVAHMVHVAVAEVLRYLLEGTSTGPGVELLCQALALVYERAAGTTAVSAAGQLPYTSQVFSSVLLLLIRHVTNLAQEDPNQPVTTLERFCDQVLLPAMQQQPTTSTTTAPSSSLPSPVLEQLLSFISHSLRSVTSPSAYATSSFPRVTHACVATSLSQPPVTLEPATANVTALRLAIACFPTAHHSLPAQARYSGVEQDADDRDAVQGVQGQGLVSATTMAATSEERKQLLQLLKHQAVRQGALAAARRLGGGTSSSGGAATTDSLQTQDTPAAAGAAAAVAGLECAAAAYGGGDLQEAEWHTLLNDVHVALLEAVRGVQQLVVQLGQATSAAAWQLLAGSGSGQAVTGAVALQLLRQLDQRGLLSQHPAYADLMETAEEALQNAQPSAVLPAVVQSVHVVLNQLRASGTSRLDHLPAGWAVFQQRYRQQFADVCEQLLTLLVAAGSAVTVCTAGGVGTGSTGQLIRTWLDGSDGLWTGVGTAVCSMLELSGRAGGVGLLGAAYAALGSTDKWLETSDLGLYTLDALLSLALGAGDAGDKAQGACMKSLSAGAYVTVLHAPPSVMSRLSLPVEGEGEDKSELPEYEQGTDVADFLIRCGLHPHLASAIGGPTDPTDTDSPVPTHIPRLSAWAVLLAHLTAASSAGADGLLAARGLRHALGDVNQLVPTLLDELLHWLPLNEYLGGRTPAKKPAAGAGGVGGAAADGDFRALLRGAGVPGVQTTRVAQVLYAGVLHALPASARTWFGDLRDRGTAMAVEAYTAAMVSPVLLAAEMQEVQSRADSVRSDQFTVRVSPITREVVAQVQVEEGSSMELAVKLPTSLPLKPPEVECRRRVGVNDTHMRKWLLSISAFLRTNNRGVADAISMWRDNVQSEFEGVEPCLICYSVIAATNSALPKLQCHTCQVRFHAGCLYKWFKSSGKSACPHCQSPW